MKCLYFIFDYKSFCSGAEDVLEAGRTLDRRAKEPLISGPSNTVMVVSYSEMGHVGLGAGL